MFYIFLFYFFIYLLKVKAPTFRLQWYDIIVFWYQRQRIRKNKRPEDVPLPLLPGREDFFYFRADRSSVISHYRSYRTPTGGHTVSHYR